MRLFYFKINLKISVKQCNINWIKNYIIMEIVSPQKQITLTKGISKLESIGKKGKLKKMISITLEHFEFLK